MTFRQFRTSDYIHSYVTYGDAMDIINYLVAILTLGLGAFSMFLPKRAMVALDLRAGDTTMGLSEVRASVGGLWLFIALGALLFNSTEGYLMLAIGYTGAGLGRLISIVKDSPPMKKALLFLAVEVIFAALLFANNL